MEFYENIKLYGYPCKHCGKKWEYHNAISGACPIGLKTRIGYIQYHAKKIFEAKEGFKPRKKKDSFSL